MSKQEDSTDPPDKSADPSQLPKKENAVPTIIVHQPVPSPSISHRSTQDTVPLPVDLTDGRKFEKPQGEADDASAVPSSAAAERDLTDAPDEGADASKGLDDDSVPSDAASSDSDKDEGPLEAGAQVSDQPQAIPRTIANSTLQVDNEPSDETAQQSVHEQSPPLPDEYLNCEDLAESIASTSSGQAKTADGEIGGPDQGPSRLNPSCDSGKRIYFKEVNHKIAAVFLEEDMRKELQADQNQPTAKQPGQASVKYKTLDHYLKSGRGEGSAKDADKASRLDHVTWFLGEHVDNVDKKPDEITVWLEILIAACRHANPAAANEALKYFGVRSRNQNTLELIEYIRSKDVHLVEKWIHQMLEARHLNASNPEPIERQSEGQASSGVDNLLEAIHRLHSLQLAVAAAGPLPANPPASKVETEERQPVAIHAAKSANFRVFQYCLHHLVMGKCQSSGQCHETDGTSSDAKLDNIVESLRQVNEQSRNILHVVFSLSNIATVHQMLNEIYEIFESLQKAFDASKEATKPQKMQDVPRKTPLHYLEMQDVFRKTPLHYLFDRTWPPYESDGAAVKSLEAVVSLIGAWQVSYDVLSIVDAEGLNILFTLVKSQGVEYVQEFRKLFEKDNTMHRQLHSSEAAGGLDIAHVFAAYGDLTRLEQFVKDFCNFSPRWQQQPPHGTESKVPADSAEDAGQDDSHDVLVGWSVIHFACMNGNEKNIKFLLDQGYRLNELTAFDEWNGIDLSVFYGNSDAVQKAYREWWYEKSGDQTRWWLSSYLTVLDLVNRASRRPRGPTGNGGPEWIGLSRRSADRTLSDRKYTVRFEEWQNEVSVMLGKKSGDCECDMSKYRHYINCLLQPERIEAYLYLCLEMDSAQIYDCLLNSTFWNTATATHSVDDIECSAVRFILERRIFKSDNNKEQPECCASELFPYLKNGGIFLENLKSSCKELQKYSLIGLALQTGRTKMAKALLITRQSDLIPTALQTIIQAQKLIDQDKSKQSMAKDNENLKDVKDFAYRVFRNAIDTLYAGTTANQADLIVRYLLGELSMPEWPTESTGGSGGAKSFLRPIYLHNDDECERCRCCPRIQSQSGTEPRQSLYQKGIVLDSASLGQNDPCRCATVDFYVRGSGEEAAFEEGPLFQHHLRRSSCLQASDDRRRMKCCLRRENELPLFSIIDLATKAETSEIFATDCFRMVSRTLWNRSIVASRHKRQKNYSRLEKALAPKWMVLYYTILHIFYLALLMKHMLSDGLFFSWELLVIAVYICAFLVQETFEIKKQVNRIGHGLQEYLRDPWNWLDLLAITFTVIGLGLTAQIQVSLADAPLTDEQKTYYLNDATRLQTVYNAKVVLGFGFLCSCMKLLHVLRFLRSTGPSLTIFYYVLIRDIIPVAIILAIVILGFGTYFYAMLTVGSHYFTSSYAYKSDREGLTMVEVYARPLLDAFGELDLSSLQSCRDSLLNDESADLCYFQHGVNIYTYCGVLIFGLLVNLVMMNMLIARFTVTIGKYEKMSEAIWLQNRQRLLLDFSSHWTLPPPLNLVYLLMVPFVRLGVLNRRKRIHSLEKMQKRRSQFITDDSEDAAADHNDQAENSLENFLLLQADRFRNCRNGFYLREVDSYGDVRDNLNTVGEDKISATINFNG